MASDDYTVLNNTTVPGGDAMDESAITYGSSPTTRKRPRVVLGGDDGSLIAVKPGSTAAQASDPALVVAISPNNTVAVTASALPLPTGAATAALQTQPGVDIGDVTVNNGAGAGAVNIQDGGNSITVDGTVSVSGSVPVTGPLTNAELRATPVPVDGSGVTQPVSAASLPLPTGAATEASLVKLPLAQGSSTASQSGVLTQAAVTTNPPTYTTGQTSPLSVGVHGGLRVEAVGKLSDVSIFGDSVDASRNSQIGANFINTIANNNITSTVTNGGTTTQATGQATLSTGANINGTAKLATISSIRYSPNREIYATVTGVFPTAPTGSDDYIRAGLYDASNGVFFGYKGSLFGITVRSGGVDTFTPRSSWNGDPLDGSSSSQFTRGGVPEAIDFTKQNLYRIRFGWLGSAPIIFEVSSPDGKCVIFHTVRQPNLSATPSIQTPELPLTCEVGKVASDATVLQFKTSCWDAGVVADLSPQQNAILDLGNSSTTPLTSNSVFTGVGFEVLGFAAMSISVFADVAGTISIQHSSDNSNWDVTDSFAVAAGVGSFYKVTPHARYFRVQYTNGGSGQAAFRLQTVIKPDAMANLPPSLGIVTTARALPVVRASDEVLPTTGGSTNARTLSVTNTTGVVIKSSPGRVWGITATNTNANPRFLKLYNTAVAPTVGTTTPTHTYVIPGNTVGAGLVITMPEGCAFTTGIGQGITTGVADNDTGAPAANEVVVNIRYT